MWAERRQPARQLKRSSSTRNSLGISPCRGNLVSGGDKVSIVLFFFSSCFQLPLPHLSPLSHPHPHPLYIHGRALVHFSHSFPTFPCTTLLSFPRLFLRKMLFFQSLVTVLALSIVSTVAAPHGLRRRCSHPSVAAAHSSSANVALASKSASESSSEATSSPFSSKAHSASSSAQPSSSSVHSSSASSASPKPSAVTQKSASGLLAALFPVSQSDSWTTSSSASDPRPLSDSTLRPTKLLSALSHDYVTSNGKEAMKAHFQQGSYTFHEPLGGLSFYAPGPSDVDLTTAKEATFGYSVFFPDGFEFNKGGKLPGLCMSLNL